MSQTNLYHTMGVQGRTAWPHSVRGRKRGHLGWNLKEGFTGWRRSEGPFQAKGTACPDPGGGIDHEGTLKSVGSARTNWPKSLIGLAREEKLPWRPTTDTLPSGALNGNGRIRFRSREDRVRQQVNRSTRRHWGQWEEDVIPQASDSRGWIGNLLPSFNLLPAE